jgi:YidC/Oxa1 family membrane protein insertase
LSGLTTTVTTFFGNVLSFLHDLFVAVPFMEAAAWGWAIIALTLVVRIALLPLAIKQTRSMRAMQALQPQIKELQKKYKVDRELMRKDPEQYKAKKQKLNEEMMALYQREGANPAASCLPLLAQAPIFLALFWTLRDYEPLIGAEFYFFTGVGDGGLEMIVREAGWPGWLLIVLMSGTMFVSQKQMMARNAAQMADNPMAQQQKILLYVMPVFLAVISFQFPLGILLYWVTTNVWQVAQQWIILREVQHEVDEGTLAEHRGGEAASKGGKQGKPGSGGEGKRRSPGASSGKGPSGPDAGDDGGGKRRPAKGRDSSSGGTGGTGRGRDAAGKGPAAAGGSDAAGSDPGADASHDQPSPNGSGQTRKRDHLPRRGGGRSTDPRGD